MSSSYPGALDAFTTKTDGGHVLKAEDMNNVQDAIVTIETELGTNPSGAAATVADAMATKLSASGGNLTGDVTANSGVKVDGVDISAHTHSGAAGDAPNIPISSVTSLQSSLDAKVSKAGDTMSGNLALGGNRVTGVGTPSASDDAATKGYVDGLTGTPSGMLVMYGGSSAPSGWLLCDGAAVSRTTYAALYTAVGTTYGAGDGSTTFNLPDLRGRISMGAGTGTGGGASGSGLPSGGSALTARSPGGWGGAETHLLATSEMPGHTHTATVTDPGHNHSIPNDATTGNNNYFTRQAAANAQGSPTTGSTQTNISVSNSSTGGGGAHNNVQPFMVMSFIIKT